MKHGTDLARKSTYNSGPGMILPPLRENAEAKGLEFIGLGLNENQLPPSKRVLDAIIKTAQEVNYYPDNTGMRLRMKLAEKFAIDKDMIAITNGADEAVLSIGKAFVEEGDKVIISHPSYPTCYKAISSMGGELKTVLLNKDLKTNLDGILAEIDHDTKMVMLCNPANPASTMFTEKELVDFMKEVPQECLVVLDEAYYEFANSENFPNSFQYLHEDANVIILRTFSKFYSIAGLRVGFAIAPFHIMDCLRRAIPAFTINSLALSAADAALDDTEQHQAVRDMMREGKEYFYKEFKQLGFDVVESHTNFVFPNTHLENPNQLVKALLERGIMVGGANNPDFPQNIRITIGKMEQNRKLIAVMKEILRR